jgi:ribosomal protein L16 Arg81 hydroxylase
MSETNQNTELAAAELEDLQARAKLLGVKHHPSAGADTIRAKIKEHQAAQEAAQEAAQKAAQEAAPAASTDAVAAPAETERQKVARIRAEAEALVRIRVTCMNPMKKDWNGEIITVGNRAVGTLKKYVPFNADEGWHVPQMIYDVLKARQCQIFVTEKTKNGVSVRKGKLIKEFAIEVLDPLTKDELAELARRQAMEAGQTA